VHRIHHGVENVLEVCQLCDCFLLRSRRDHFVRRALSHDAPGIKHDYALAQGEDFFATMRDIENRNAVGLIPLAQIVDDRRLRCHVQRSQGLVQKQHSRISHKSSC